MSWSLSEIEGLARKAARGAGFDWGMAEEAGRAVRWLASVGLPGPEALAMRLQIGPLAAPQMDARDWRAQAGPLCALTAGAALGDRAAEVADGPGLILHDVAQPLLLVPFIAGIASETGRPMRLAWGTAQFAFSQEARGRFDATQPPAHEVAITPGAAEDLPLLACGLRYEVPPVTVATLSALAQLTYAPESEASRIAGAGAGLSDND